MELLRLAVFLFHGTERMALAQSRLAVGRRSDFECLGAAGRVGRLGLPVRDSGRGAGEIWL